VTEDRRDWLRPLAAEAIGTGLLVAAIVGSGIMGDELSGGNAAVALLANTLATGAALVALIYTFGPISGAHFNPVVTLVERLERRLTTRQALAYVGAQIAGGLCGTIAAHVMFEEPLLSASGHARAGLAQGFSEAVAAFGLIAVILSGGRFRPSMLPVGVAAYITAAVWFTASTSFANPAVTVARSVSDTFTGIRPADVPLFVVGQVIGACAAAGLFRWMAPATAAPGTISQTVPSRSRSYASLSGS
jgi:glycerol uptake facilitator-like aquaporin